MKLQYNPLTGNFDNVGDFVPASGGTFTGPIGVADPVSGGQAVSRDFADARAISASRYVFRDDFDQGGTSTGSIGAENWLLVNGASGSISVAGVNTAWPYAGAYKLTTSAGGSGEGGAIINQPANATNPSSPTGWELEMVVRPQTIANVSIRAGLIASAQNANTESTSPSRGVYVQFDTGAGDTNFMGVVGGLNGTEVRRKVDLGVAPVTNTWVKFHVRAISATEFGFSVNGGAELTVSAQAGDSDYQKFGKSIALHTLTAAAATFDIDFYGMTAVTAR